MSRSFRYFNLILVAWMALPLLAFGQVTVPRFGVMFSQGSDVVQGTGSQLLQGDSMSWQRHSMVLDVGSKYLSQYLMRCRLPLSGRLQVNVSGVRCDVRESRGYGRASYRITYSLDMEAYLDGKEVWKGSAQRREVNMTGAAMISEGVRLLLVKEGVNKLVKVMVRRELKP